jgi:hypothetical protein
MGLLISSGFTTLEDCVSLVSVSSVAFPFLSLAHAKVKDTAKNKVEME